MGWGGVVWVGGGRRRLWRDGEERIFGKGCVSGKCERMRKKAFKSVFLRFFCVFLHYKCDVKKHYKCTGNPPPVWMPVPPVSSIKALQSSSLLSDPMANTSVALARKGPPIMQMRNLAWTSLTPGN